MSSALAVALLAAAAPPATLDEFETALAATPSASEALESWCRARIDRTGTLRAVVISASSGSPTDRVREELDIGGDERLGYRRVSLECSGRALSLAYNWYVPSRLSPEMNTRLEQTNVPFGRVAAPLGFTRQPLEGARGQADYCPVGTILSHRALLRLPDGRPLAMVVECYTGANLESARRRD